MASAHFVSRAGRARRRWVKLSLSVVCGCLFPLGLVLGWGPTNDKSDAPALLEKTLDQPLDCLPPRLYADVGYDADWIHAYYREECGKHHQSRLLARGWNSRRHLPDEDDQAASQEKQVCTALGDRKLHQRPQTHHPISKMPGICGIILNHHTEQGALMLEKMVNCMMHEPFYSSGIVEEETSHINIGWVCHAGSFADYNPIWNASRDITLVFFGEHFDETKQLDARSLLAEYEEKGVEFIKAINGVFSGVLVDRQKSKVIIFNDRFGLGRIFFHEDTSGFYFSSEAKSLLKILPKLRQLDTRSFAEFFSFGCALQNRTLFNEIHLMPGGSAWIFERGETVRKITYFEPSLWENQAQISVEQYYERLETTFTRILPRYFRENEMAALSLTGGLDSRMILACIDGLPNGMPCYTFGGPYRDCADVRIARQLANMCNRSHKTITVTDEFFKEFSTLARWAVYITDGGMDVMGSVELFVNKAARKIAPVRITGNYGSEILRGNVAFKPMPVCAAMFDRAFAGEVRNAQKTYTDERRGNTTSFIAFKQVPWHHHSRWAIEQSQLVPRSPYLDNEIVELAYHAPKNLPLNKSLAHRFIESANPNFTDVPTDRGASKNRSRIGERFTALREEFMPKMEYLFDYGMPQWLARHEARFAPLAAERLFLGRQKFYHFRIWYRDQLSNYVKEMLLDPRTLSRPYLDAKHVEELVRRHLGSRGNYTIEIHKLLTSELIQRELIENN